MESFTCNRPAVCFSTGWPPHSSRELETVSSRRSVGVWVTGCATDSEGPRHITTVLASWDMWETVGNATGANTGCRGTWVERLQWEIQEMPTQAYADASVGAGSTARDAGDWTQGVGCSAWEAEVWLGHRWCWHARDGFNACYNLKWGLARWLSKWRCLTPSPTVWVPFRKMQGGQLKHCRVGNYNPRRLS